MTIGEIKEEKIFLEKLIYDLVYRFEEKTSLKITDISILESDGHGQPPKPLTVGIKIKTELKW